MKKCQDEEFTVVIGNVTFGLAKVIKIWNCYDGGMNFFIDDE